MRDLLAFKAQELGASGALSSRLEQVRVELESFYDHYPQQHGNLSLVVGHMKRVAAACSASAPPTGSARCA